MKPVKNFRTITPRCCLTCRHTEEDKISDAADGFLVVCKRSGEPEWGDPEEMPFHICDGYASIAKKK